MTTYQIPDGTPDHLDPDILADAAAFDAARADKPITATPAVHAVAPVAAVLAEDDGAAMITALRLALAQVAREATYDGDGDSLTRGERLDQVRRIARGALA